MVQASVADAGVTRVRWTTIQLLSQTLMHTDCICIIAFSVTICSFFFFFPFKGDSVVLTSLKHKLTFNSCDKNVALSARGSTFRWYKSKDKSTYFPDYQLNVVLHRLLDVQYSPRGTLRVKPICWWVPQWVKQGILEAAVSLIKMFSCFSSQIISEDEDHSIHLVLWANQNHLLHWHLLK